LKDHLFKIVSLLSLVVFVFLSPFKIIVIQGNSMYPTLKDKQIVLGYKTNSFDRNDIVVAYFEGNNIIKRIKYIEGDRVYYLLKRNFDLPKIVTKDFFDAHKLNKENEIKQNFIVEKNRVFVVGDNSLLSDDSRRFGCIETDDVKYKIIYPRL
jgi:signal peptidase I